MHTNSPCRKLYIADPQLAIVTAVLAEKGCDHDMLYILSNKREKIPINLPYRSVFTVILILVKSSWHTMLQDIHSL